MGKVASQIKPIVTNFGGAVAFVEAIWRIHGNLEVGTIARASTGTWEAVRTRGSFLSGQHGFLFVGFLLSSVHLCPFLSADWLILLTEFLPTLSFMSNITATC